MSSSSSFSDLADIDTVSNGIQSAEVEALKKQIAELEAANQQLIMEKEAREARDLPEKESILTSIVGSWSMVSSVGMEEYLEKWNPSPLDKASFEVAIHRFENYNDVVTMTSTVGFSEVNRGELNIGEKTNGSRLVENNALIEVSFLENGEEDGRSEMFLKHGLLNIVTKRFGMECTRIYEKIGAEKRVITGPEDRIVELEIELGKLKIATNHRTNHLQENLDKQTKRNDELQRIIRTLHFKNHHVESELEKLKEESKKVKEDLEQQTRIADGAKESLKKKSDQVWDLLRKLVDFKNRIRSMKEEFDATKKELEALKGGSETEKDVVEKKTSE